MSHFALLWKARTIEKYRQRYEDEKINSIVLSNANIPEKTLLKRWKHYRSDMKKHLSRTFSKWYPEGTTVSNFVINFTGMKFPHILLRSAVGFLGGLILTYLCFVFFVFQLSISLFNATVLSSLIGILLTLGLTLSNRMRCLVFLLIPQLFSRVGRFTLTCYALVLILTGPATNTLKNSEVLSESMACSQEQIKLSVRQINESVKKPFNSIKDSLNSMIDKMKNITWKLKVALVKTNRALITFASIIQSNFFWLDTVSKKCNAVLGTPYKRCSKSIESTAKDYHKITKDISWFKTLIELGEAACEFLQPYKEFCVPPDYVETTYLATIKGKLKTFTDRIKSMLFIHIKIQHSYTFIGNTSRTPSQVAAGIVTEIRNRADPIFTWLSWSSCVTSLFLLLIIFRAKHYQHMYETRSRFDNRYITKEFRELDLKRQREGRYTVLPLNRRERAKYVTTTSFRLVASEKVYLNRSAVFMMVTTFKLLIHIVADYSLYWVLMTIRYHGSRQTVLRPGVLETGVHISGEGFVARFLKSLVEILDIPLMSVPLSRSNTCLPNPLPPDFNRYGQIGTLIFLLWLFALFEPYGLRMRHLIMGHYRPERAKDRALWLYNHILRTRGSFMKFARRKLHREYKYSSYLDMTLRRWLLSIFPKWLGYILGLKLKKPKCLLCNITEESDDFTEFIKCSVSFCPGTYCDSCYADIGKMCTICMSPQDYGDISDISLEGGSSNEDSDDDRNNDNDHNEESFTRNEESEKRLDLEPDLGSDTPEIDDLNSIYEINDGDDTLTLLPINTNNNFQATLEVTLDYLNVDSDPVIKNINVIGILDNYIKTDGFTNKTAKVSQITRMGLVTTAVFQCWYSFYEMNVIGDQILVKRVRSLNYKIRCRKKCSKKIKTVLNGNKITQNNDKGEKKDNADPPKSEKGNYKSYDNNAVQTNEDKRDNKKKKCKKKYNPANVDSKSNTIRSNYMKYIFVHLIPCTDFRFNTQKIPESYQSSTSSVKKKKKWKKSNASPKPSEIAKNNPQESRNYRIAAYLAELEWIKNKENKSLENDTSLNIEMEEKTEEIDVVDEHNDSHIKINDVMIPKLKLNFSTDSITEESETIIKETPSYLEKLKQFAKKNNKFAKIALDRYFKRNLTIKSVVSNFNSFDISKSSVEIKNHIMEDYEVQNNLLSNFDIPRTMKYFDSMHKDLDDIENFRDKPDFDSLDNISSSNLSVLQKKKPSKEVYNKISEENVLDKIIKVPDKAKGKESSEETILGWSRLKRVLSGRLPEFGGPLSIMKGLYSSLFIASNSERSFSYKSQHRKALAEKGVLVCPSLCTCGCQKDLPTPDTMTRSVQINSKYKSRESSKSRKCKDIQVDEVKSTCTCATQYCVASRDVGTFRNVTMIKERVAESTSEAETLISQTSLETSGSIFTMRSETSKTDTTICSLLTVDYNNNKRPKNRVKVITKANQSTLTDQTKLRDVSTLTDDWWSPIIEKKFTIDARHNNEKVQRRDVRKSKDIRNRGMTDAGRIVKFKSHAQIIPREPVVVPDDILSPSRYLLESQKYYNELFSTKFYSPHVLTMAEFQHHQKSEKVSSKGRNHYRLSRKTKRLENCYSPRRTRRSDVH